MSLKTFLIKILRKLEDKDMSDVTVDNAQTEQPVVVADAATTDNTTAAGTASENAPVTATADTSSDADTDSVKDALKLAGHDVESYWDAAVSFGKKIDSDVFSGLKKALVFVDSEIETIFDDAVALAKLKK